MICPKCKKSYPKDWKFCPECSCELQEEPAKSKTSLIACLIVIALFGLTFLFLFNTGASKKETSPKLNQDRELLPFSKGVDLIINPEVSNNMIRITGKTNLPDNTELIATVSCQNPKYIGQTNVKVLSGSIITKYFTLKDDKLPKGSYLIRLQSPGILVQKPSIRDIFGTNGQNLKGPYVKFSEEWNQNIIFYKTSIDIK